MFQLILIGWLMGIMAGHAAVSDARKYECLPPDVKIDEVVSYARKPADNVTVEKQLIEMKARCDKKLVVDANNREILFFRVSCWGNPPPDYLEREKKEKDELEKLKKNYTVIVMGCDPRTP